MSLAFNSLRMSPKLWRYAMLFAIVFGLFSCQLRDLTPPVSSVHAIPFQDCLLTEYVGSSGAVLILRPCFHRDC